MQYRVAVASTDGVVINQHFGHAEHFHIVALNTDDATSQYLETRQVKRVCQGHEHSEAAFDAVLKTLSDVSAILVAKIGQGASDYLESKGMLVYESPFWVDAVIEKILKEQLWEVDKWQSHTKN